MESKESQDMTVEDIRFNDVRKKGLMGNIDKKRTLLAAIKRNALKGSKKAQISVDDLRFKTWENIVIPHSNAVVIAMMDTSGSMGVFEKYIARSFFFWMTRFLRTKYENVEMVLSLITQKPKKSAKNTFSPKGKAAEPFVPLLTGRLWKSLIPAIRMIGTIYIRSILRRRQFKLRQ